jgi:hypothetical protein
MNPRARITRLALCTFLAALPSLPAFAQQADPANEIEELRRQIDVLAEEIEQLRSGEVDMVELTPERQSTLGLAPSAAAAYERRTPGISFAGYGEMLFQNYAVNNESGAGGAPPTQFDFLRVILYSGYRFSDKFLFNSEIEIEHAKEIFVEFAYVDYMPTENLTVRGGMVLVPLGLVNEFHEPTAFIGAKRPETESRIIPSTWRENGAGILGSVGLVNFRAYVTNGFNGSSFSSAGVRKGRQKGGKALAANMAFSGRLDITPTPGVFVGVGLYSGGSGQEAIVLDGETLTLGTMITEVHGQAQFRGFDVRALFAQASIDQAGKASRALGLEMGSPIAETMQGGYIQVGYDLLSQTTSPIGLTPYVRYEQVDTQHRVPTGFTRDLSRDGTFTTFGVELKPIPNVVVKADYQRVINEAGSGRNQFNINLGYAF